MFAIVFFLSLVFASLVFAGPDEEWKECSTANDDIGETNHQVLVDGNYYYCCFYSFIGYIWQRGSECDYGGGVGNCGDYSDQGSCVGAGCKWCDACENLPGRYVGLYNGRCIVPSTSCSDYYYCSAGECLATCSSSSDSSWSGTTCSYNCDDIVTCTYDTCPTMCSAGESYCKYDEKCYCNVGCTSAGCSETEGEDCTTGTCDSSCNCNVGTTTTTTTTNGGGAPPTTTTTLPTLEAKVTCPEDENLIKLTKLVTYCETENKCKLVKLVIVTCG